VSPSVAAAFLTRLPWHEAAWTGEIDVAVGAMTDSGALGVALQSPSIGERATGFVAVAPGRRRLGLGADLLLVLLSEAANQQLRAVTCAHGSASASWKLSDGVQRRWLGSTGGNSAHFE
jgi:GNAT superfamily N-acetyltransferase